MIIDSNRFNIVFINILEQNPDAKRWSSFLQSIYRFAGSDINLDRVSLF